MTYQLNGGSRARFRYFITTELDGKFDKFVFPPDTSPQADEDIEIGPNIFSSPPPLPPTTRALPRTNNDPFLTETNRWPKIRHFYRRFTPDQKKIKLFRYESIRNSDSNIYPSISVSYTSPKNVDPAQRNENIAKFSLPEFSKRELEYRSEYRAWCLFNIIMITQRADQCIYYSIFHALWQR